ncbi:glycoside hydrolase family 13 protein [Russula earlei]|uniref:Glycoside hydrolase family 13 protein n=1 Tax=Russula earlei TaxID=71964 RepID=A0ACC0UJP3_9AGAM|nr:glycoside hydrolase family 13 protein [Russula earlei]
MPPSLLPVILAFATLALLAHCMPLVELDQLSSENEGKAVIAQMFEWTWDSVAAECTDFLGPSGYGFVQVSPAQEHVRGHEWWTDYQPVSYILTSKRGDRIQYRNMIKTCHAAGVNVIADTIWNHMTARDHGVGVAGSRYTHYEYPGIYGFRNFHHCGLEPNDTIVNYNNSTEVWTCELGGLADLATDTDYVRWRLAEYTNDLIYLGIDGIRLDAAKHIKPDDIADILSRLERRLFITQEVIWGSGEAVTPDMYVNNGHVQEFRYTTTLRDAFLRDGIASLQDFNNRGWVAGSLANAFVANHDTERNGNSLNAYSPSNSYILATVFSLAHPYGTVSVLSSYSNFYDTNAGGPNGGAGNCSDSAAVNRWFCQHRWPAIAGMVGFRNHVGRASLTGWTSRSSQQIAFGRGSSGFVAINNEDVPWNAIFATGLPAGSYCNVFEGGPSSTGICSGNAVLVTVGGSMAITIGPRQAIAVHTGAMGVGVDIAKEKEQVSVLFSETATTSFGENILVVGSLPELGNWDPSNAIPLDPAHFPVWGATVYLPPSTKFEYKFIRKEPNGKIVWESGASREDTTPAWGVQSIVTSWEQ